MSVTEHYLQLAIERLETALADAIVYLRLMPRAPVTTAKIAELEKVLAQKGTIRELEDDQQWKVERFTPAGHPLRMCFEDGELRFETGATLEAGASARFKLTPEQIDAFIDALAAHRQNSR